MNFQSSARNLVKIHIHQAPLHHFCKLCISLFGQELEIKWKLALVEFLRLKLVIHVNITSEFNNITIKFRFNMHSSKFGEQSNFN